MKQCKKCHIFQDYIDFPKNKKAKDGFENICKACRAIQREGYMHLYYEKNKLKFSEDSRLYNESHKEEIKEMQRKYRENNREEIRIKDKKRRLENQDKYLKKARIYREKTRESHKEERSEYYRKYRQENKDAINLRIKKWTKEKYNTDINFKITRVLRGRVRGALKGLRKEQSTLELVGCNIIFLKEYLEKLFQPNMSWNNYGKYGWHIDHIIPCNTFDLSDANQIKKCFHYTNLRPLWASDNLKRPKDGSDIVKSFLPNNSPLPQPSIQLSYRGIVQ